MKTFKLIISGIILIGVGLVLGLSISGDSKKDTMSMDHDMEMESMMIDMTARMLGKKGDALDKIFLEDMIVHHQGAVDMAIIIKENTERPELKAFAQEIIDVQDQEINMMKSWLAEWFMN